MKVLLVQDVYKLGRAGDVKKVADGYGRNYLIPQGLAVLATPSALKQVEHIRAQADAKRAILNQEMSSVAKVIAGLTLSFPVKAGETGKLYGSVTTQMIAEAIKEKTGVTIDRRAIDTDPIRDLGVHTVTVRLTMDLTPTIKVITHREGESPEAISISAGAEAKQEAEELISEPASEENNADEAYTTAENESA